MTARQGNPSAASMIDSSGGQRFGMARFTCQEDGRTSQRLCAREGCGRCRSVHRLSHSIVQDSDSCFAEFLLALVRLAWNATVRPLLLAHFSPGAAEH